MASTQITVMTCDRCGKVAELRRPEEHYEWGKVWAAQSNGPKWIGGYQDNPKSAKDACPDCIDEIWTWWKQGKPAS